MSRTRVLVVEDDEEFQELYKEFFRTHEDEFSWMLAKTGDAAVAALKDDPQSFDVALIDWCLRRGTKNGFQVLQVIHSSPATRHIVCFMVTGNEYEPDVQAAIQAGAEDYITKPFKMELLVARLRGRLNRLREQAPRESKAFEIDGLRLDVATGVVVLDGKRVDLWRTEVVLLGLFLQRPDQILTREFLWDAIRGYPSATSESVLTKQISNLRTRLGQWGERLEARRGQGYMLNARLPITQG